MLIRLLLEDGEEGLFNADCLVAHLLYAIKRKLQIPKSEDIDLCTPEGELKQLYCHKDESATQFFTLRELCLAVTVQDRDSSTPHFTPVLSEYATNETFVCLLNSTCCAHVKPRQPLSSAKSPVLSDSTKAKLGAGRAKKRRNSAYKA